MKHHQTDAAQQTSRRAARGRLAGIRSTLSGAGLMCIKDRRNARAYEFRRSRNPVAGWTVMNNRHASDIISHQNPLVLAPTATVKQACQRMHDRRVGAVLVVEGDRRLVGIFTGRDAVGRVLAEGKNSATTTLAEVMTRNPDTIPPRQTAIEALRAMQDGGYRHLPVIDGGKVVGVISRGDFRGLEQDRLDEETGLWERI
jgi:CBS domain-containing protein